MNGIVIRRNRIDLRVWLKVHDLTIEVYPLSSRYAARFVSTANEAGALRR